MGGCEWVWVWVCVMCGCVSCVGISIWMVRLVRTLIDVDFYMYIHSNWVRYHIRQKDCNKCTAAELENGAMCAAFLPPCAPHFDGRTAVRRLVECRDPRIVVLFATKMRRVRRIVARLAKDTAIPYPAPPAQIQRQTIKVYTHISVCIVHTYISELIIIFQRCSVKMSGQVDY